MERKYTKDFVLILYQKIIMHVNPLLIYYLLLLYICDMYNEVETAVLLNSFYRQLCHNSEYRLSGHHESYTPATIINEYSLVEYLDSRPVFRFRDKSFIFGKTKNSTEFEYFNAQLKSPDRKSMRRDARVDLYEKLFPFITFIRNETNLARSGWYESNQLLELLPTRKKFIDEMLLEL